MSIVQMVPRKRSLARRVSIYAAWTLGLEVISAGVYFAAATIVRDKVDPFWLTLGLVWPIPIVFEFALEDAAPGVPPGLRGILGFLLLAALLFTAVKLGLPGPNGVRPA